MHAISRMIPVLVTNICRRLLRHRCVTVLTILGLLLVIYVLNVAHIRSHHAESLTLSMGDWNSSSSRPTCIHPHLKLWSDDFKLLFQPLPPPECSKVEEDWVYVTNGIFHISSNAVKQHGDVTCEYIPIYRGNDDFQVLHGDPIRPMEDGTEVTSDVFRVVCSAADGYSYRKIHLAIAINQKVIDRSNKFLPHLPASSLNLSILMFGFDSVSRMTWMRNLPKSYEFIVNKLGGVVMEGYNVVGDGTPQALLPILTGQTELELPEARRGFFGAKTVDSHPWIWKDLQDVGYVTQWGEESPNMGTFTYRMLGFRKQPVDHYMRTYFLAAEPKYSQHKPHCVGSVPRHKIMMNAMTDFVDAYSTHPRFSFVFHSEYSHDANSKLQWADNDFVDMLRYLKDHGHLEKSLLVLMSDHGARFQNVRATEQGKYEERLPFVAVRVPTWFSRRYPYATKNLRANANRLTTPFDLHETFLDVIDFSRQRRDSRSSSQSKSAHRFRRGFSLFEPIPVERSCEDADIEPHWCSCLSWRKVPVSQKVVHLAAEHVVFSINNMTSSKRAVCALLSLANITFAVQHSANEDMLKFKGSSDMHGRVADFTDDMKATEVFYQITFSTVPSGALYEATVTHILPVDGKDVGNKFVVNSRDISRINRYGSQPDCVAAQLPHLRPYCYCKSHFQTHS